MKIHSLIIGALLVLLTITAVQADDRFGAFPIDSQECRIASPVSEDSGERTSTPDNSDSWCSPNWICSEWSECMPKGIQTRDCEDKWECGSLKDLPALYQECEYEVEPEGAFVEPELFGTDDLSVLQAEGNNAEPQKEPSGNELTGAVTDSSGRGIAWVYWVLAGMVAGLIIIVLVAKRNA